MSDDDVKKQIDAEERQRFSEEMQAGLEKMMIEVKRKLKGSSKNELIRICCALLVENYSLKQSLSMGSEKVQDEVK